MSALIRIKSASQPSRLNAADASRSLVPILPQSFGGGSVQAQPALVQGGAVVQGVSSYPAATALSALRAVWLAADGVRYASSAVQDSCDAVLGITAQAVAAALQPVLVRCTGPMTDASWEWTQGDAVFLGVDGLLTQTPDDALPLVELGIALDAHTLLVRIQTPFF